MSGDLHVVKGQPDADELAAVVIALDIVAARVTKAAQPVSRWRTSLHRRSLNATRDHRRQGWRSGPDNL
jgi:hypothetical protein